MCVCTCLCETLWGIEFLHVDNLESFRKLVEEKSDISTVWKMYVWCLKTATLTEAHILLPSHQWLIIWFPKFKDYMQSTYCCCNMQMTIAVWMLATLLQSCDSKITWMHLSVCYQILSLFKFHDHRFIYFLVLVVHTLEMFPLRKSHLFLVSSVREFTCCM